MGMIAERCAGTGKSQKIGVKGQKSTKNTGIQYSEIIFNPHEPRLEVHQCQSVDANIFQRPVGWPIALSVFRLSVKFYIIYNCFWKGMIIVNSGHPQNQSVSGNGFKFQWKTQKLLFPPIALKFSLQPDQCTMNQLIEKFLGQMERAKIDVSKIYKNSTILVSEYSNSFRFLTGENLEKLLELTAIYCVSSKCVRLCGK